MFWTQKNLKSHVDSQFDSQIPVHCQVVKFYFFGILFYAFKEITCLLEVVPILKIVLLLTRKCYVFI